MLILALLALQSGDDVAATLSKARVALSAEPPCRTTEASDEILVCRRRDADKRYRITFVASDPRDDVHGEREGLLAPKLQNCGRIGGFFTDCGFVGATMTSNGRGTQVRTRELAR